MKQTDAILDSTLLLSTASDGTPVSPIVQELSDEVVLDALQRITTSKGFDAPDRSRRLLEYIVREALGGRGNRIKAYSIATEVLGRPSSFDPQKDPVVRIEAARLRRALEHYYLNDTVVLDIPKGGYVATFKVREPQAAAEGRESAERAGQTAVAQGVAGRNRAIAGFVIFTVMSAIYFAFDFPEWARSKQPGPDQGAIHTPGVTIKPLVDLTKTGSSGLLVQGLTERIIERTSRFRDLTVIASDVDTAKPTVEAARYEFGGTVRMIAESLAVQTRLVDRTDGRVLWADSLETSLKAGQLFSVEAEISNQIAAKIGEPNGIIFNADRQSAIETPPENWDSHSCMLHAYALNRFLETALGVLIAWAISYLPKLIDSERKAHGQG
jgi:TolB-like protein